MLNEAIHIPSHDIDHADLPILHPDVMTAAKLLGIGDDPLEIGILNGLVPRTKVIPVVVGLKSEAEAFVERMKSRGHKGYFQTRQAMNLLLQFTGDIDPVKVTSTHFASVLHFPQLPPF